jgi:hypothetical protein
MTTDAGKLERLHASRTEPLDPRVFKALQDAELEPTA